MKRLSKYIPLITVFILGILPVTPLLAPGLPITHDGADHLARIANFYRALQEGVVFPRWAELLNWGYGHPILMFLYPFSSYMSAAFHVLGFSFIDSLKIVFAVSFVASGVTMFFWARNQFNEYVGVAAALFYLYAPYRFVDLYVRGAIGEHVAFIFPPLVLYFIYKYFKTKNLQKDYLYTVGIGTSFACLLLSHNAISLMFIPFFVMYIFYLFLVTHNKQKTVLALVFMVVGLFLSGFFTIPAFFEGKFTLRDIVTGDEYKTRFVSDPRQFIYSPWNYGITGQFSVQLGIVHLLGILLLPFVLFSKLKRNVRILLVVTFIFFAFSLFIQLSYSNFIYEIITTFKKFQFPWRFLSLSLFTLAILSSSFLLLKTNKFRVLSVIVIAILLVISTYPFWKAKGYFVKEDIFYERIYYGTTDTGESAPIWSVRFMEKEPLDSLEIIEGSAQILKQERTSVAHTYTVHVLTENARLRENTLYFPGWNALIDGKKTDIQFQDPNERGLITFFIPQGKHKVDILFTDTKLRMFSNMLSLVTLFVIIVGGIIVTMHSKSHDKK